ncbi:MAG: carbohydrate ABC transporter substrate-binding protein, partial [Actinobacteria bacterium]
MTRGGGLMRKAKWLVAVLVFALIAAACGGDGDEETTTTGEGETTTSAGGTDMTGADFELLGPATSTEGDALTGFLNVYNEQTGAAITYVGLDDFEQNLRIRVDGGDPPPVAFTPQPASICTFADEGHLVSLEDMGFDVAQMETDHTKFWMDLGLCADGKHYGIPWFPNYKSIIFYHEPTFTAQGYEIPTTYDDLVALSSQMVSDGFTPWCFGLESGDATGWPGTDWIEDIMVRMHGGDVYGQWFRHEIPFNDERVVAAFDKFGEIMFGEDFVLGGPEGVSAIAFGESPLPLFNDPPGCLMLKQGSFIQNFFPTDVDTSIIKFFAFPTIDGNTGAMGGGDTIIVFDDDPQIAQAVKDWITPTWNCVLASENGGTASEYGGHGVAGVERLPGHKDTSADCYDTEGGKILAQAVLDALAANAFVFDASDLMPVEV